LTALITLYSADPPATDNLVYDSATAQELLPLAHWQLIDVTENQDVRGILITYRLFSLQVEGVLHAAASMAARLEPDPYVRREQGPMHKALHSIPLQNLRQPKLIYGILNLGSFSEAHASHLNLFKKTEAAWLIKQAHEYVLNRLLEIFPGH
jgi:hypothetical protein